MRAICYGDSNTYGYEPGTYIGGRYPASSRWVDLLSAKTGWTIENEGLNGRQIPRRPIQIPTDTDLLIVMLGTNDLLQGAGVNYVTKCMENFLNGLDIEKDKILLIAPPPMKIGLWAPTQELVDASIRLADSYRSLASKMGIRFANAGDWHVDMTFDGVHFTAQGHENFSKGLYSFLTK